jgi:ABC-type branched-subunit amino acid transport system ATPase component/ABC-type branched-subunit amino acid transport system permease subunit
MSILDRPRLLTAILIAVCVILYPLIFQGPFLTGIGILVGAMAVGGTGFVLIFGYAHQLVLGHTAFAMIGGYASGILTTRYGWDPFVAMIFAMMISIIVAYITAKPILRLRGLILAMGSIAFSMVVEHIAFEWHSLTHGAVGLAGIPKFSIFGWVMTTDRMMYYLTWVFAAASVFVTVNIDTSKIGRALKAVSKSEIAAEASGIDTVALKVQFYVITAAMLSMMGSLLAHYMRLMAPGMFGFAFALMLITGVIIGGLFSVWGGVVGSIVIVSLREGLRGAGLPAWEVVVMGMLTVTVLILFERGFSGFISDMYSGWRERVHGRTRVRPVDEAITGQRDTRIPFLTVQENHLDPVSTILSVSNVGKKFGSLEAVFKVSSDVERHSITSLIGPNGAGKTTLFNLISGHLPLTEGEISLEGQKIEKLHPHEVAKMGVSRTFQSLQLYNNMTVLENVMSGRHRLTSQSFMAVAFRTPKIARDERYTREVAEYFLKYVGLEGKGDLYPDELPFGHQRLVETARALALEPRLILMDEPASGLNDAETEDLAELLFKIRQNGITIFLVEHDIRLVMGVSDRIAVMNYGRKIAEGPTDQVRNDPEVIAAYLGAKENDSNA